MIHPAAAKSNVTVSKPVDKVDNIMIIHLCSIQPHLLKRHKRSKVLFLVIMKEEVSAYGDLATDET
jgi:hypothetical protein